MMETMTCPYCECRVRVSDVDDEGGCCPECGAIITSSHLVAQDLEREELFGDGEDPIKEDTEDEEDDFDE
jgi:transcription initiation factor TFIIIB Brf1 subunit/transcription initiation factor TFIIB